MAWHIFQFFFFLLLSVFAYAVRPVYIIHTYIYFLPQTPTTAAIVMPWLSVGEIFCNPTPTLTMRFPNSPEVYFYLYSSSRIQGYGRFILHSSRPPSLCHRLVVDRVHWNYQHLLYEVSNGLYIVHIFNIIWFSRFVCIGYQGSYS